MWPLLKKFVCHDDWLAIFLFSSIPIIDFEFFSPINSLQLSLIKVKMVAFWSSHVRQIERVYDDWKLSYFLSGNHSTDLMYIPHAWIPSLSHAHVKNTKYLKIGILLFSRQNHYFHFCMNYLSTLLPLKEFYPSFCRTHTLELVRTPSFTSASLLFPTVLFLVTDKIKNKVTHIVSKETSFYLSAPIQYRSLSKRTNVCLCLYINLILNKLNWP